MAAPISINVSANAQGVYDEIIRQARRAEAIVKKIPLRIETKDLGNFKTLTADIDRFDKSVSRMSAVIVTFGQAAAVIFGIQNAFAAMVKSAINVEKKLTDINVIAKGSTNSLQKLSDGLFSIAKQTGQSFDVAATAAQEFSRQGLSVSETLKRTRDALTLTRIAGIDAAKATQSLTAIFNTFNKEALDTTKITNTLANLDVKFAVSVGDLTEALSRAGSTAADAKTSFTEMAAATTSLQQITARGGSVIGNSLKSIFTRLQRNDTVQSLKEIGVNVRDLEGNMRPALKVLEELSKKFYTLTDSQRASIKEQVAGVYQVNQLSALLADLSSEYSVYRRALDEANKSQDNTSDRLELLKNNTAGSLNDIVVNLTRFSGEVGKIFLKPLVKDNLDFVNKILESTKGFSDSNDAGAEVGKGIIQGLATYLSSGGALIIGKSLFNIFRLVAVGVKDQIVAATTLNRTSEQQLQLQEQVKAVMLSQDAVIQRKIASTTTEAERQKVILGIIEQQTSAMLRLESVASRTAKFGISAGFSPVGGFKKGKTAASGYLPSIMAEKHAINAGVGGANKGAKPVVIPNFNLGNGKRETVVANSSEYIVPNFAGGDGSAIFNQKMVGEYGLPRGAKRIMAGGHIPNITASKAGSKAYNAFIKRQGGAIEDIQSLFSQFFGRGTIPTAKVEDLKSNPLFRNYFQGTRGKVSGFYNYSNNSISLNKNQAADPMLRTYAHEMGHAAQTQLSKNIIDKLNKALKRDISIRGESVGETFLGSHAKSYKGAEFEESLAESIAQSFIGKKFGDESIDSGGNNSLMYRYIRRAISNKFAEGYIPNFKKEHGSLIGEGSFGSFYNLKNGIGVKRFHSEKYPDDLVREYIASKVLENEKIIPGITGPKVVGSLSRSLVANRIGKMVVNDQLAETSLIDGYRISKVLETMLRDRGVSGIKSSPEFLDMNTGNFTVNSVGAEMLNSDRGRALVSKYRYSERGLSRLSKFFEKKGGLINIIDPGYLVFPKKIAKKYLSNGYIPNFNPLKASLRREASSLQDLGYSREEIFKGLRVQSSSRLQNSGNPAGFGVFNTLQGQGNISKALSDHSGENLHKAGIPNFATPVQAYREILGNLRLIERGGADTPFGRGRLASAVNPLQSVKDVSKSSDLVAKLTAKLGARIQKQIAQIDLSLKVSNLETKSKAGLYNQQKYLQTALSQLVQVTRSDAKALKNPEVLKVVTQEHENRVKKIKEFEEKRSRAKAEKTAKQEKFEAERDQKLQQKQNRRQNLLLGASFGIPMLTEQFSNAAGGQDTKYGRLLSDLGGTASSALTLGTFGGPLGIAAGIGVGAYGALGAYTRSKESFAGQFGANKQLQSIVDQISAQEEAFGAFSNAAVQFNDAKGGDTFAAADKLNAALRSFEDKDLGGRLAQIAFDPSLEKDVKAKKQVELYNVAQTKQNAQAGVKVFRSLYAEATDSTGRFKRLNGEVEVAPDKIKKFASALASSVDATQLKSPITDDFVKSLIKGTGTDIESQSGSAARQIRAELKYILRSNQITSQLSGKDKIDETIASKFNLKNSVNTFGQIQKQKDFQNKLGIDIFKIRAESPLVGTEEKFQADQKAAKAEVFAEFSSNLGGLAADLTEKLGDQAGGSKTLTLINGLLDASGKNDFPEMIRLLEETKETFKDIQDDEIKDISKNISNLLQVSSNQLTSLSEISKEQAKNRNDAKLLSLFDKMGVKGLENRGRTITGSTTKLITAEQELKDLERLPQNQENKIRVAKARSKVSDEFIKNTLLRKELNGGSFNDLEKSQLRPKVLSSFEAVGKGKAITDIEDAINTLASTNGFGRTFSDQFSDFKKVLSTGDTGKIPEEINKLEKRIFSRFYQSDLNDPRGLNKKVLQGGISNLRELGGFALPGEIEKTAIAKTDELLGKTPVAPSTFPNTAGSKEGSLNDFSSAQKLLETSTGIFAKSAEELANAIKSEQARNKILGDKTAKDERVSSLNSEKRQIEQKLAEIEKSVEVGRVLMEKYITGERDGSITNDLKNYFDTRKIIGEFIAEGNFNYSKEDVTREFLKQNQIKFDFARLNPNSETGKEVINSTPGLSENFKELDSFGSTNLLDEISKLKARIKQINDSLSGEGIVPNFDPYSAAIRRAKTKESLAGVPHSQIYVDRDKRLISHNNPLGIGIANRLDEPNGLFEGVDRKISRGKNPKLSEGNIPNFAEPTRLQIAKLFEQQNGLSNLDKLRDKNSIPSGFDNLRYGIESGLTTFQKGLNNAMSYIPNKAISDYATHRAAGFAERESVYGDFFSRTDDSFNDKAKEGLDKIKSLPPPKTIKEALSRFYKAKDLSQQVKPNISGDIVSSVVADAPTYVNPFKGASTLGNIGNFLYHGIRGGLMSDSDPTSGSVVSTVSHGAGEYLESKVGGLAGNVTGTFIENGINNKLNNNKANPSRFLSTLLERQKVDVPNFALDDIERKYNTRNGLVYDSKNGGTSVTPDVDSRYLNGKGAPIYDSKYGGYINGYKPNNYYGDSGKITHPNDLIPSGKPLPTNPLDLIPKGSRPTNPLDLIPKPTSVPHPLGDKPIYQGSLSNEQALAEARKNIAEKKSGPSVNYGLPPTPSINSTFGPIRISPSEEREINNQKYSKERDRIFSSLATKKNEQYSEVFGPLTESQSIFKKFKDKQNESAIQKTNNKGIFDNPKSVLKSNVAQNNSSDNQNIEKLQNLVASLSDTVVQIKQETSRSLNLNIGGSSISVKDFEEMEERILNTVKSWTNRVRTLEGTNRAIV